MGLVVLAALTACSGDSDSDPQASAGGGGTTSSGGAGGTTTSSSGGSGGAGGTTASGGAGGAGGTTAGGGAGGAGGTTASGGAGGAGGTTASGGSGGVGGATGSGGAGGSGAGGSGGGLPDLLAPIVEKVADKAGVGHPVNAIGVDSMGVVHVVHAGSTGLYYATRGGSGWSSEPIEEGFMPGQMAKLAIDAGDLPHVLYRDDDAKALKYARKVGGVWSTMTVDASVEVNTRLDLALDAAGDPHAVFQNLSGPQHGYAHWTGSGFATEAVPNSTGAGPSIVLGGSGTVYTTAGGSAGNLAVGAAGSFTVAPFDATDGIYDQTDLAIDASGDLHVVYVRGTSRLYVKRTGSTWGTPVLLAYVANNAQIAVDSAANPYVVGYAGGGAPLYLGRFESGEWKGYKIALSGNVPSIVIDAKGKPHISYYDTNLKEIWYATY